MKISDAIPKGLLKLVIGLGVVAVIAVLALVFLNGNKGNPDGNNGNNDGGTDGTDGPRTEVKNPTDSATFKYATISEQDTLMFVSSAGDEIFTQLDHKSWRDIRWSPDGKLVSVLGKTGEAANKDSIYDLFVYDFTKAKWEQITFFKDSGTGITGYDWAKDLHIVFTQGPTGQVFLHDYDYPNSELLKKFQLDGVIVDYLDDVEQYVVKRKTTLDLTNLNKGKVDDNSFDIFDKKGKLIKTLNAFKELNQALRIATVQTARSQEEFILTVHDFVAEQNFFYSWSFAKPELKKLIGVESELGMLNIFCGQDINLLYASVEQAGQVWWGSFNPDTASFAGAQKLTLYGDISDKTYPKLKFSCDQNPKLLQSITKDGTKEQLEVFEFSQNQFKEIEFKNPIREVAAKIGK